MTSVSGPTIRNGQGGTRSDTLTKSVGLPSIEALEATPIHG